MGFVSAQFLIFICIVLAAHQLTAPRYRYVVLFAAGCYFYACAGGRSYLGILLLTAAWTYLGGRCIERSRRRPAVFRLFWWGNLALLAFYKIGDLLPRSLAWSYGRGATVGFVAMTNDIVLPVGMSFYIFTTCWYLSDVYRKGFPAERNPIRYGAFATFFPSVLSGPIQKGRELLPMIRTGGAAIDRADLAIHGFELFLWGMFVKLFVSNRLSPAVAYIFDRPGFYSKAYYLPAAILFALQLYADFAAYSDMAIGTAAMLGYPLRRNFNNPFLSTSLSELWNRWHVSLNEWFLENIYFPLGGSRKGTLRKYVNEMVIFITSGLWHGQGIHFLFWGVYNGALMLAGQLLPGTRDHKKNPAEQRGKASMVWAKRFVVFLLFSLTFIFFRAGTMEAGLVMTAGILTMRPSDFAGFYPQQLFGGSTATMLLTLALTMFFLILQYQRREEAAEQNQKRWNGLPVFVRVLLLALLLALCVISACGASAATNSQFVYYDF